MHARTKALMFTMSVAVAACGGDTAPAAAPAAPATDVPAPTAAPTPAPTSPAPTTTIAPAAEVLFDDPLDTDVNGWGEKDGEFGSLLFVDGDFQWRSTGNFVSWTWNVVDDFTLEGRTPPDYKDVTIRAEATPLAGTGVIGVSCRVVPDNVDAQFEAYAFVVRDGYAAIQHSDDAGHIELLAEVEGVDLPFGQRATIEATCVDGADGEVQLDFVLNGEMILSTTDAEHRLGNGFPTLLLVTFPAHEQTDVDWHHFTVLRATGD